jgi:hypothetical protein
MPEVQATADNITRSRGGDVRAVVQVQCLELEAVSGHGSHASIANLSLVQIYVAQLGDSPLPVSPQPRRMRFDSK